MEQHRIYGETIRPYSSTHIGTPSLCDFSIADQPTKMYARILGDTVATIEDTLLELVMTPLFRKAWEAAHVRATMNTTDGTAQPEWLDRFRKVRTPNHHKPSYPIHGVRTQDWWRTYQDSNPGFRLRRPK